MLREILANAKEALLARLVHIFRSLLIVCATAVWLATFHFSREMLDLTSKIRSKTGNYVAPLQVTRMLREIVANAEVALRAWQVDVLKCLLTACTTAVKWATLIVSRGNVSTSPRESRLRRENLGALRTRNKDVAAH